MVMRSAWALLIMIGMLNKDLIKITIFGVKRDSIPGLTFRSIQGAVSRQINYAATKFLPLAIVGIVNNMSPLVTVVLAYFLLKEKLKPCEFAFLMCALCGMIPIIVGGSPSTVNYPTLMQAPLLYAVLFANPFLTGGGTVAVRKLRKLNEFVVSWYTNLTTFLLMGIVCLCA